MYLGCGGGPNSCSLAARWLVGRVDVTGAARARSKVPIMAGWLARLAEARPGCGNVCEVVGRLSIVRGFERCECVVRCQEQRMKGQGAAVDW